MISKRLAMVISVLFVLQAVLAIADVPTGANHPQPKAASAPSPSEKSKKPAAKDKESKNTVAQDEKKMPTILWAVKLLPGVVAQLGKLDLNNNPDPKLISNEAVGLKDEVLVKVKNLKEWLNDESNNKADIILYLNGLAIKDIKSKKEFLDKDCLLFHIDRTPDTKDLWKELLGNPGRSGWFRREVRISAGIDGAKPFSSNSMIAIQIMSKKMLQVVAIVAILIAISLVIFPKIRKKLFQILKDTDTENKEKAPFSLARVQMAIWFLFVVAAFVLIYMITGYYDNLNASVLALIGISSSTGVFATVIDDGSRKAARDQISKPEFKTKKENKALLDKKTEEITSQITKLSETENKRKDELNEEKKKLSAERTDLEKQIDSLEAIANPTTSGFIKDILTFGDGDTTFHRFQMVVWTVVLLFVFLNEVYSTLSMPEFSVELLGLMGISSGTYIGFKIATQKPEKS